MSSQPVVELSPSRFEIDAGITRPSAAITITNNGTMTSWFTVTVNGLPEGWYTLEERRVALYPRDVQTLNLDIDVPRSADVDDRDTVFTVIVHSDADEVASVEGVLRIHPSSEVRQQRQRQSARSGGGRSADGRRPGQPGERPETPLLRLVPDRIQLMPGERPVRAALEFHNRVSMVDQYNIVVSGLDSGWYTLRETSVSAIFLNDSRTIPITFHLPRKSGFISSRLPFTIELRSSSTDDVAAVSGLVEITGDLALSATLRTVLESPSRGQFDLLLDNAGTATVRGRVIVECSSAAWTVRFLDSEVVRIGAGGQEVVRLEVLPPNAHHGPVETHLAFTVIVTSTEGQGMLARVDGTYTVPRRPAPIHPQPVQPAAVQSARVPAPRPEPQTRSGLARVLSLLFKVFLTLILIWIIVVALLYDLRVGLAVLLAVLVGLLLWRRSRG
jgi:hypothetical protein